VTLINGLRQGGCRVMGANVDLHYCRYNFQLLEEVRKDGSHGVDRAYFRVMRIQTVAGEVATPLSHLVPARYENSPIVFD
jgi:hypothetical protein